MTDDQVARLLEAVAGMRAQMGDVLRRLDRIEEQIAEGDRKRDAARDESRAAHDALGSRLSAIEARDQAADGITASRWRLWAFAGGLVTLAATVASAFWAIVDHT